MPRPLRNLFPGVIAHVTNRGAAGQDIFLADGDRQYFLWRLETEVIERGWECHAFCLMDNHYHLLLRSPSGDLSRGMQAIAGEYASTFNRVHERVGHLFQGRFRAIAVERQEHALELARYIALNPVRAGIVDRPEKWPWSSYAALRGGRWLFPRLQSDWLLDQFGSESAMREFVEREL